MTRDRSLSRRREKREERRAASPDLASRYTRFVPIAPIETVAISSSGDNCKVRRAAPIEKRFSWSNAIVKLCCHVRLGRCIAIKIKPEKIQLRRGGLVSSQRRRRRSARRDRPRGAKGRASRSVRNKIRRDDPPPLRFNASTHTCASTSRIHTGKYILQK